MIRGVLLCWLYPNPRAKAKKPTTDAANKQQPS